MVELIFGEVLREVRRSQRMSQNELADNCFLDRTFISMLERGIRQPTIGTIFKISKALNISATELIAKVEEIYENRK